MAFEDNSPQIHPKTQNGYIESKNSKNSKNPLGGAVWARKTVVRNIEIQIEYALTSE